VLSGYLGRRLTCRREDRCVSASLTNCRVQAAFRSPSDIGTSLRKLSLGTLSASIQPGSEKFICRAFSILADPLMVLAAAAQRTTRIRLGTAVTLLPLHNPIKIAEEASTADILSDGRFEFGVGRGVAYQYPGYGVPLEESRERFEEALDFIVQAWTNEPFSFEGKHFRARDLSVVPKPLQSPHPPVRIAANSPDTFPFSGRRKLPIFASPLINPPDKLKAGLAIYRDTLGGTPGDTALAFPVHVTTSRAQARQDCEAA
jgi:alkanesulfonate monooxygenase SsuD/methylene tetrahydromethanopterin reductase-like flavin-dependent oxidoreductase (luciferase family)